jgi:hypothetical protein
MLQKTFAVIIISFYAWIGYAQDVDLTSSRIFVYGQKNDRLLKAAHILQEEISKRSEITLSVTYSRSPEAGASIAIGLESQMNELSAPEKSALEELKETGTEGFKIITGEDGSVIIAGHDEAGALYGTGWLLRKLEITRHSIILPARAAFSSTPAYPVRGHQLGYRPKTNSYDAWTVAQYDSYIRDLLLFGANSIEIMPPRTDDEATSIHMKLPAIKMIAEQSRICNEYRMHVWMWYPNMGSDYITADSVKKELEEREQVFSVLPRLDALFVPGGDPGELEPDILFGWLEKVAVVLHKYHPEAKIWVSPQVFKPGEKWYNDFYRNVNKGYAWFGGVVYGPWIRTPLPEVRNLIGPAVPIRLYPDITHSLSCQYPVPGWDLAFAMTLGRECINPRPFDEMHIHNIYADLSCGSISYSEGTNDDVNKFIWTCLDWDPSTPVMEILRDYARFFIGPEYTDGVSGGLVALELNMKGPLISNDQVEKTFMQWQDMESSAPPGVLANPRFQSGLIRAYYDTYIRRRLLYETDLEMQARDILGQAGKTGSLNSIDKARNILLKTHEKPVAVELKERCYELSDSLFRTFGAQLTVGKHHAAEGRGNFIDNIDIPLNDALWLLDQLSGAENHGGEPERLDAISNILHRTDPGPGGFYDNFGSPSAWKRVKAQKSWDDDPGSLESPRVSFGVGLRGADWVHEVVAKGFEGQITPLAWMNQVSTLYDTPLEIEYDELDTSATYILKISYTGRFRSSIMLTADGIRIHDFIKKGSRPEYEFQLPEAVTRDGKVCFTWTCGTDEKGSGDRGSQVAEIWIVKKDNFRK